VRAEGSVKGLLFELDVEQYYINAGDRNIEAVYTFPMAWNAVRLGIEVILGGKVLQGRVVARADGERIHEAALEEGNWSVMVERADNGMYYGQFRQPTCCLASRPSCGSGMRGCCLFRIAASGSSCRP
jgi:Ca-activated chloride channel homolog